MNKVVFSTPGFLLNISLADNAMIYESEGYDVTYVLCDGCLGICNNNLGRSKTVCKVCYEKSKLVTKNFPKSIKVKNLSDYDSLIDKSELKDLHYQYDSVEDIKKITFHSVHIGYGCLSSYIYRTRNVNPLIDDEFRKFFDFFLLKSCYLTLLQEKVLTEIKPIEITFFNGRFSDSRPLFDLAKKYNIHSRACDNVYLNSDRYVKTSFYDSLPQNMSLQQQLIRSAWDSPFVPLYEKEQIGRWFFESKIKQKFSADRNYTKDQELGKLPDDWDSKKKNYVIFNSSQDEYASVDEEWDNANLFKEQIDGVKFICDTLAKEKCDAHVYLRIHPNLRDVKYKYHTDLLSLPRKYKNLTVIDGNSNISSYTLMDAADKVIVFASTIGIEAAYASKKVILLAGTVYDFLNIAYKPSNTNELREMLLNDDLPVLDNYNCLKYGFSVLNPTVPGFIFYTWKMKTRHFFKKKVRVMKVEEIGGENIIRKIVWSIKLKMANILPVPTKEM